MSEKKPERWGWRVVQQPDSHAIAAMLLERVELAPPSDPCIFAVREDWFGFLDRTDEGQRRLALVKNAPALADEAGLIEAPDEAAGCVPCLRCGGFRAPGETCALGCGAGVLWSEAKRMRAALCEIRAICHGPAATRGELAHAVACIVTETFAKTTHETVRS